MTFSGSPVTEGQVSVYSAEMGVGASAPLDQEGRYAITEPIPTGQYAVTVLPPPEPPPQEEIPVASTREFKNIPAKYRDPQSSGLTVQIEEGENVFDVPMTP